MARGRDGGPAIGVKEASEACMRLTARLRTDRRSVKTAPWTSIVGSQPGKSTIATSVVDTARLNAEASRAVRLAIAQSRASMILFVSTDVPRHTRCTDGPVGTPVGDSVPNWGGGGSKTGWRVAASSRAPNASYRLDDAAHLGLPVR